FSSLIRPPPRPTLFPYTTLFRSELTVREAVHYSARFRLPPDFSDQEVTERVETTLRQLGLEAVAHLQIGRPEQKVLSGGQRKRRSEEHTSELQSRENLVCRLLLE